VAIVFKLAISLAGMTSQRQKSDRAQSDIPAPELPVYSILVPVYREPKVIPTLLQALARLDYPPEKLDVILLFEEDDAETIAQAKAARPPHHFRFVYIPKSLPRTKPKACNYGLQFCRGEFVTIYDAEDIPDPGQLKEAVRALRHGGADLVCVQAALNYFNSSENVLTRMFTLEYSFWFDYVLPGLDRLGLPIPLGGTSNHFPVARLRKLGAWDPFNVTEDADLGIRATVENFRVGVIRSTTYEEANRELGNWIRQRSRWIKGYMQTWLVHNRRPASLLRAIGLRRWLSYQFFIGGTCLTFLANPVVWLVCALSLLFPAWMGPFKAGWIRDLAFATFVSGNGLAIVQSAIGAYRRRLTHLLPYALLTPFYWCLHSIAAYVALWQLFTKPFYWEKTTHGLTSVEVPGMATLGSETL
jgi:cellulose synthase/poly-beta-1,6-N-acetylglucosamine synthase-like glycosyltransferase